MAIELANLNACAGLGVRDIPLHVQANQLALRVLLQAEFVGLLAQPGAAVVIAAGKGLVVGLCVAFMGPTIDQLVTSWAKRRKAALGLV